MNEFKISQTQGRESCNMCFARNYDSGMPNAPGKRVDQLYDLEIGRAVITLCEECMNRLGKTIFAAQQGYYDEAGGFHRAGLGWNPFGHFCGECLYGDCKKCISLVKNKVPTPSVSDTKSPL